MEHIGWRHAPTASHCLKVAQVLRPRGPSRLLSRKVSSAQALVASYSELNSMLFAPVPCSASINKSSACHFGPVRVGILRLLAAVNVVSPFHPCLLHCTLISFPSLSYSILLHFQLSQARSHIYTAISHAVCVTTHKGSWVKLLMCFISIVTRSSSHLTREMNQNPGSKHCFLF